jgi:hypothetical protein
LEEDFALLEELFSPEHMDELIRLADITASRRWVKKIEK